MDIKTAPLWEWILLLVVSFVLAILGYALVMATDMILHSPVVTIFATLLLIALYVVFVRWFEGEWASDVLQWRGFADTGLGLAIGAGFFLVVVGLMLALGCCSLEWRGFYWAGQFSAFAMFFCVAAAEEILFRGILFRLIDRRWGFWAALIASALVFGLIHITNDNATLWSSFAIAIEAGLLLGAAYKWAGTLWLPIGIHWAWNYTQGNIFGFAVSGSDAGESLWRITTSGPDILTGGAFGAEASILSVILGTALSALFIWGYLRKTKVDVLSSPAE